VETVRRGVTVERVFDEEEDAAAVLARKRWEVVLAVDRMADVVETSIEDMMVVSSRCGSR